ncbi:putative invertase inhibitor [Abrus precatorius]|uniref:Invertase inhibitor n=1 Tax=Abrus precatorius TaxID=3816 RepID=A0A8B8JPG5_ABRPR|nr:putative invertase inhibitor [Abrus precatorius]
MTHQHRHKPYTMASRKTFNQLLLMSCFVLLGQCGRIHNTEGGEDLVTATCKHTLHFQVCISSLKSVPGSKTSNPKMLAYIALNLSTTYAAKTLSYIYELKSSFAANGPNNNIYVSRCLSDCAEEYSEAIENLQNSAQALLNGEYDKVDTLVSAAMSDAETCEDGFKDMLSEDNDSTFPLTEYNRYFSELCSNALAIRKLLV